MTTFALDTYGQQCAQKAVALLLENRGDLVEPIGWIKLQQGGQAEIWVSNVTVNHGVGNERSEMQEKHFEMIMEGDFPAHVDTVDEDETLEAFAKEHDVEDGDVWDVAESALTRELLIAGHAIKAGLKAEGIKVHEDCVVCCGDEDNTWGWATGQEFKPETYIDAEDLEGFSDIVEDLAKLFYENEKTQTWLVSRAKA